ATVPIGRPIANTRVYLLDGRMRPVPAGMRGELYAGGDGVARGYLGRPALTAERFVPDPFSEEPGVRLYRTGDVVRHLPGGVLEFVGRADGQVKVRGFRVELGEVEAALREHAAVNECAVVVRVDETGEGRLVGHVARRAGHEVSGEELRQYLAGRVPGYMVPAVVAVLERLPLTANGKVDRAALPEVTVERPAGAGERPVGEIEEVIARLWEQVLGVEGVGRRENFFEAGGHSLRATQLMSRVRETFGVQIPLVVLFERPTVAELAAAVEDALRAGSSLTIPPVVAAPRTGPLPLSFAQQRLWFLDRLMPEAASYNVPVAYRIGGRLDVAALERSLNRIVERHEVLRTTIAVIGTEPSQIVRPASPLTLEHADLAGPTEDARAEAVRREVESESRHTFDLATGPVVRARLLRLAEEEHVLVITMHHIVADGWSVGVLARELSAFYEAEARGAEALLPELPVQYADYAAWQRGWLQGEELERQLAYWREQLAGAPTVLELPADRPRPKMQTGLGGVERFEVGGEVLEGLQAVGREEGATLFMTLLAAFGVFLSRYSARQDLLIGAPIANRGREEFEGLVGFFSNTLVLRTRVEDDPSFRDLLRRARAACLGAYAHQDVPFEALVEELQPERDLSRSPLFQVVLTLQNAPLKPLELADLDVSRLKVHTDTAKFDLGLNVYEEGSILAASFEYNRDIFEPATIRGMVERFQVLLEGIIKNPEQPVSDLPFLKPSQLQYYVGEWNETAAAYPLERCVHELVAEQAARTPDAVAVVHGSQGLTYAELDADANRLARYLVSRGAGPGTRVAVMLEHSPRMVAAVLGVLKAGAAYVPLEPGHPPLRLAFQLEDSEPVLLLTQQSLLEGVEAGGVPAFLIDAQWHEVAGLEAAAPEVAQSSDSLAYIIYTSGSTGRPKGVKVTHRSLCNYVWWAAEQYLGDGADSFALYSSLAFDLTVTSLFAPLICGRRVVVYAREGRESPILRVFEEGACEVVKLTPSHLSLVASLDNRRGRIRRLVVGGESLEVDLARRAYESFGGRVEIVNEYGPTEATVGCMIHRYDPARDQGTRVPIGRPAANSHVYVVDARGREAGEDVAGELLVSGEGVAAGYHNRAELTAERFVADPYRAGARAYRTGDVARRLPGGLLDYVGRRDEQVKYHGHRVELGELRAALNSHPEVRDSVVRVMRREAAGREVEELVCYYVSRREVEALALREHLRE
ncbi:MAG TPA: amino acid adenylation domain-containing protein, partial [Pyrinomonadaceae bacterium]